MRHARYIYRNEISYVFQYNSFNYVLCYVGSGPEISDIIRACLNLTSKTKICSKHQEKHV